MLPGAEVFISYARESEARVDATNPPIPFSEIQCVDLSKWSGDVAAAGWRKIIASVEELVARKSVPIAARRESFQDVSFTVVDLACIGSCSGRASPGPGWRYGQHGLRS